MKTCPPCIFCISNPEIGTSGIESDRIIDAGYDHWWLVLQPEAKRQKTKIAAGIMIVKRHIEKVSLVTGPEAVELMSNMQKSAQLLCEATGVTYTGQESVGYNQGREAGQTVMHGHVHILPVAAEDPAELKMRGGIGGAFEALHRERLQ
jgi:diadenosine tetraphosphate (Ap4A) HIT family hydrolase